MYFYHHHHHISVMELGHLLTRSGFTYPEVSSNVCHNSFCQLGNSVSLTWVIYYGAFYLHVVSSFSYIPVICLKLVLFLIPLQFVYLFCNQSKCILLFFLCISSLLCIFIIMFMYSYFYVCSILGILFHCVVLCIICVLMYTALLPTGVNSITVNKYIITIPYFKSIKLFHYARLFCCLLLNPIPALWPTKLPIQWAPAFVPVARADGT